MNRRCELIIERLKRSTVPVTASSLAEELSVSRQVIVGDVAIIRAAGISITATARGYVLDAGQHIDFPYVGIVACQHDGDRLREELYAIVDFGGTVIDVSIEHAIYGEICGQLGLSSRYDVEEFIRKVEDGRNTTPISALTGGVHLHKIGCRDEDMFVRIKDKLRELGIIYRQ